MHSKYYKLVIGIILLALTLAGFSAARAQEQISDGANGELPNCIDMSKNVDGESLPFPAGADPVCGCIPPVTPREVIYLSDTLLQADGRSLIFTVAIDQVAGLANLNLLPGGDVPFDHVDVLAATPDGSRIYLIDDGRTTFPNATLAYYDLATDQVTTVGVVTYNGENMNQIDQAAFSNDGVLYITHNITDSLYTVNLENAEATLVGPIVNQASGELLDIYGADITFTKDGTFYLINNRPTTSLFRVDLPDEPGTVNATLIGPTGDNHRVLGLAVRANGYGDLVASTQANEVHIIHRETGADIVESLPTYWNGSLFDATAGDMATGTFKLCNSPKQWWAKHSWGGMVVTVVGVPVDQALGQEIMRRANSVNFSMMVAQLTAAKLNVNNATGIAVIDEAEAWLAGQGLVLEDGTLDWAKHFESREQRATATAFADSLRQFNESTLP